MISTHIQKKYFQKYLPKHLFEALDQNKEFNGYRNKVENVIAGAYVAFVDIANFSSRINGWGVDGVKEYLEQYYQPVFRMIYKYHGQIDKIMGDGIVVVFSDVFGFEYPSGAGNACLAFCKECIKSLADSECAVKSAIASGSVYFCKTGVEEVYEEISCIGHPMTIAFRLENEASVNEIWMLGSDDLAQGLQTKDGWFSRLENVYLKGVEESEAMVYQYNPLMEDAAQWTRRITT